jgi:hypothetical protein
LFGSVDEGTAGGMARLSRNMSACTVPVKFWKPAMMPEGMPVMRIAVRSARFGVPAVL